MHPTISSFYPSALPAEPNWLTQLTDHVRHMFNQPGLSSVKHHIRNLHGLLTYDELRQMKALPTRLPLAKLLEQQPRFFYKYLSNYTAAGLSRRKRLTALLHHYKFLGERIKMHMFQALAGQVTIWQEQHGDDLLSISLSYPLFGFFEGELSLNFSINSTILQMVVFVITPGSLVHLADAPVMLVGQVQGTLNPALIKHATKLLHDITPANLLVNAAYGLASAWSIGQVVGVGTRQQLSVRTRTSGHFDYDAFWQQFHGERTTHDFFVLNVAEPEKPIEEVKAKYRARTLRKRLYKQTVRMAVEQQFRNAFLR